MTKESSNLKGRVKIFALPTSSCESTAVQQTYGDEELHGSLSTLIYRREKKQNEAYLYPQVANGNKSAVFSFVVFIPLL
jgi:hypothetical protein